MTAKIIDGKKIAQETISEIKEAISKAKTEGTNPPGLAVVQVGGNPVSKIYVRNKRIACDQVGMQSFNYDLPEATSEKELIELVASLNNNPEVNGILVQLPLPDHINETKDYRNHKPKKGR